jgi:hypothetical protein
VFFRAEGGVKASVTQGVKFGGKVSAESSTTLKRGLPIPQLHANQEGKAVFLAVTLWDLTTAAATEVPRVSFP